MREDYERLQSPFLDETMVSADGDATQEWSDRMGVLIEATPFGRPLSQVLPHDVAGESCCRCGADMERGDDAHECSSSLDRELEDRHDEPEGEGAERVGNHKIFERDDESTVEVDSGSWLDSPAGRQPQLLPQIFEISDLEVFDRSDSGDLEDTGFDGEIVSTDDL